MTNLADQDPEVVPKFPPRPEKPAIRVIPDYQVQSKPRAVSSAHRVNAVLAWVIIALLVLATIPLGSNRPAFWTIWSTVIGATAVLYAAALLWLDAPARFALKSLWPEVALFILLCLFIAAQTLPLARWLPDDMTMIGQLGLRLRSLSFDPGSSRLALIQFCSFGLLLFLAAQVAINRRRARQLLLAILVVIAAFAVFGLASLTQLGDTLLGFDKTFYQGYATGTFVNRNSFAGFLAVGLTIGVPLLMQVLVERRQRLIGRFLFLLSLIVISMVFIGAALFATGSRMGMASAVAGVVVSLVLSLVAYRTARRTGLLVVIAIALCGVVVMALFGSALVERLVLTPGVDESRVQAHLQIWAAIFQRPWLGYGAGSFASVFAMFQQPPLSGEFIWEYTHSTYLALWFEMGLVVGSVPLLIVAMLGWRALRSMRDSSSITTSIAALGAIVVFAAHSLLDFPLEIEANAFLFTVILALGAAGALGARPVADS